MLVRHDLLSIVEGAGLSIFDPLTDMSRSHHARRNRICQSLAVEMIDPPESSLEADATIMARVGDEVSPVGRP